MRFFKNIISRIQKRRIKTELYKNFVSVFLFARESYSSGYHSAWVMAQITNPQMTAETINVIRQIVLYAETSVPLEEFKKTIWSDINIICDNQYR